MKRLQKQLVLNKGEDWRSPYRLGVIPDGDGLTLAQGARKACFAFTDWIAEKKDSAGGGYLWIAFLHKTA